VIAVTAAGEPETGSRTLLECRAARGLTQEALAHLAKVAVRTVRGIETGRIQSPRADTLARLATALNLSAGQREQFLASWGRQRPAPFRRDIWGEGDLAERIYRQHRSMKHLYIGCAVTVGPTGKVEYRDNLDVILATWRRIDRKYVVLVPSEGYDQWKVDFENLDGCHIGSSRAAVTNARVVELVLDSPLEAGDTCVLSDRMRYTRANHADRRADPSEVAAVGLASPTDLLVLQVQFAPTRQPRLCEQIFWRRTDSEPEPVAELNLSPSAQVHVAIPSPQAGLHGIRWTW
jgi:transcriptional regulator with XRE-family HTH domain